MSSCIPANYHTHSSFCDGTNTPEEMVREALKKGFLHLGFSGHMDPGVRMDFPSYDAEIRRLQECYADQIEILRGAEIDSITGPDCAPNVEYRIGSTHFIPIPDSILWQETCALSEIQEGGQNGDQIIGMDGDPMKLREDCKTYYQGDFYALARDYYRFEADVVNRTRPTFIGHFDIVSRFNDLPWEEGGHFLDETNPAYLVPAKDALEKLVSYQIPFELNLGAYNRGRKAEPYPRRELLGTLHELGGEILLSSDAHQKELLDGGFSDGITLARSLGFDHILLLTRQKTRHPAKNSQSDLTSWQGDPLPLYWEEVEIGGVIEGHK